jgi:hypothetical protein
LERRYRRILRLYPAAHRVAHEDEMLGVLLDAAKPGQRRPGIHDTWDLLRGALAIRLRRLPHTIRTDWSDALAIVSLFGIVLVALGIGALAGGFLVLNVIEHGGRWNSAYLPLAAVAAAWPAVLLLAIARRRRIAIVLAWIIALLGSVGLAGEGVMFEWAGLSVVAAAAITWSPGPARGVELLGRRRVLAYVAGVVALGAVFAYGASGQTPRWRPGWATQPLALVTFAVGAILVVRSTLRFNTAAARRASILLVLPVVAVVITAWVQSSILLLPESINDHLIGAHSLGYWIETGLHTLLPVAALAVVLIYVRRSRRRIPRAAHEPPASPSPTAGR